MFEKLDANTDIIQEYNSPNIIKALQTNDFELLCNNLYNVFEEVLEHSLEIGHLKKLLIQNGALGSGMTGSGSAVFGIFSDKQSSKTAYNNIKKMYKTFWCISYNRRKEQLL